MNKHYLRLEDDTIIKGFSDAFTQALETDIEYTPEAGRHFKLIVGEEVLTNPSLIDENGKYKYKLTSGNIVVEKTEAEKWTVAEKKAEKIASVKGQADNLLSATDWKVIRHRDQVETSSGISTSLTESEYSALLIFRESIRTTSNTMEDEINALTTLTQVDEYVIEF